MGQDSDSAKVVDLEAHRLKQRLEETVEELQRRLDSLRPLDPTRTGWIVMEEVEGRPTKYFLPRYMAIIGYVPGSPEYVYLDYRGTCDAWRLSIEQLAAALQMGTLPAPEFTVRV